MTDSKPRDETREAYHDEWLTDLDASNDLKSGLAVAILLGCIFIAGALALAASCTPAAAGV